MLEVLFLESDNLRKEYIISSLKTCDCNITLCYLEDEKKTLENILREKTYHFVFSINYISFVAVICDKLGTKYVSWVYDHEALLHDLSNIGVYTNYIFVHDYSFYESLINKKLKTVYCLPLAALDDCRLYEQYIRFMLSILFKDRELEIFDAIKQLEKAREQNGNRSWLLMMNDCFENLDNVNEDLVDRIYQMMKLEKDSIFSLRRQLTDYFNDLLKNKYVDISWEFFTWYKRNFSGELGGIFWEFYCLATFVNISLEEMRKSGGTKRSSLLQYESIEEISRVFLQTVFYLRRMEYGIIQDEESEILIYIDECGLSEIALRYILKKAQIYNKEKVRMELQKLRRKYRNE